MIRVPLFDPPLRVYLLDDESDFRDELMVSLHALSKNKLVLRGFEDANAFYRAQAAQRCDVAVLDIQLPGEDGLSIAAELRQGGALGVIMLSARSALEDRIQGLQNGADAYFSKPTDPRELLAQILRLGERLRGSSKSAEKSGLERWRLAQSSWVLSDPDGRRLRLTTKERLFMKTLFAAQGNAVSREKLLAAMGAENDEADLHRIDVIASRLRQKCLGSGMDWPVHTVRGTGYFMPN